NLVRPRNCVPRVAQLSQAVIDRPVTRGEGSNWILSKTLVRSPRAGGSRLGNIHGKSARSENGQEGAVGGNHRCQPAEFFGRCTRPICSVWIFLGTCR